MTNAADSQLLTRVGPGTPMGAFMREYWIPAILSNDPRHATGREAHRLP